MPVAIQETIGGIAGGAGCGPISRWTESQRHEMGLCSAWSTVWADVTLYLETSKVKKKK
jgi:hypothetical protein